MSRWRDWPCKVFRAAGRGLSSASEMARLMVGIPSYAAYLSHIARHHPGAPVMNEAEFIKNRQAARYARGGGGRCC
jgi:uncharacterized short protein YbdD (DUF466 family)